MRTPYFLGTALCLLTLGGCAASGAPGWDARFGDSVRILQAQQLIAPEAPAQHAQTSPPTDGRTARESMDRHVQSYRNPPATTVIQIGNIGTGR